MVEREVLVDVTRLLGRFMKGRLPTGVDRVNLAYLAHYRQRARAVLRWAGQSFTLSREDSGRLFDRLLCPRQRFGPNLWPLLVQGAVLGWPTRRAAGQILFNTSHSGLEQPGYPALLKRLRARPVFFVHDLIPITHPEYCRPGEAERHARRMDAVLDLAAGVIANSKATLDELAAYARRRGKAMPPAVAALLAPGLAAVPSATRPLAEPYFVMLGTIEPRKNHWLMLQLWRRLAEQLGEAAPRLVVIGQRGWECENVVDLLERCPALDGFVIEIPRCSDAELADYLGHAQALLFPSFAEGYGLPLVEALALRTPVIASDLPAFREVAGDIPEYLDPLDGKAWGGLIEAYARPESPQRAAQLRRLEGFEVPSWEGHFAIVDAFLECLEIPLAPLLQRAESNMPKTQALAAEAVYACGFSSWKRPVVRSFFSGADVVFVDSASQVPEGGTLAVWGLKPIPGTRAEGVSVVRLEDGFLRSVGLGADLIRPLSWVGDWLGIYYDATRPSDLECLLQATEFTDGQLGRAKALRERIVESGLTKYNVGRGVWHRPAGAGRVILVPGQVESDASLRFGAPGLRTNLGLLRAVREANPGAYILYKPHPDVLAGLRAKGEGEDSALAWCDGLAGEADMALLLAEVDEVHVLTSLAGFEALLRGKPVTCHGQPFYAGWGLTADKHPVPRRTRTLSLDGLVAGALVLYPRYMSRADGLPISPEQALDELLAWREQDGGRVPWWREWHRRVLRRVVGVR